MPEEVQYQIMLASIQKRSSRRPTEKKKRSSREGKSTMKYGCCGGHGDYILYYFQLHNWDLTST